MLYFCKMWIFYVQKLILCGVLQAKTLFPKTENMKSQVRSNTKVTKKLSFGVQMELSASKLEFSETCFLKTAGQYNIKHSKVTKKVSFCVQMELSESKMYFFKNRFFKIRRLPCHEKIKIFENCDFFQQFSGVLHSGFRLFSLFYCNLTTAW